MRVAEAKKIMNMIHDMKLAADIMDMVEEGQQDTPDDAIIIEYHHPLLPFPDMTQAEIGDYVIIPLKNGTKARFDVTETQGDIIRLDSHDCLIASRWNENNDTTGGIEESDLQEAVNKFFDEQIPDVIKKAVEPAMRDYMGGDIKRDFETLAFIPDASELFPDENNEDYYEHIYRQMEFYKDRRNRVKFDRDGRVVSWWTASAYSDNATSAVVVTNYGYLNRSIASDCFYVPICFQINAAKLPTQVDDEIRVGDEVILIKPNTKSIVWKISGDLYYLIGGSIAYYSDELKATGRHFDEIEEVLKQIGE